MEYITLVGESYEKALEEARRKYGDEVRVHSRKEYTVGGGVFRRRQKRCELTLYLAPRKAGKVERIAGVLNGALMFLCYCATTLQLRLRANKYYKFPV